MGNSLNKDTWAIKYLSIGCVLVGTWAFVKGFCALYPCSTRFDLIVPIAECVIYVMYIKRQSILRRYRQTFVENIGWVVFICTTLVLVSLTYYIDIHLNENDSTISEIAIEKRTIDFIQGVLETLTGIWIVYIILRPKLRIYPIMAIQEDEHKQPYGLVLIKNTNWTDLMDVAIFVQCCWTEEDGNIRLVDLDVAPHSTPILRNRLYKNECTCACCITLSRENKPLGNFEDFVNIADYIRCRVIATHSLSGIRFVTEYNFNPYKCKRGVYDSNNNFKQL